MSKLVDFFRELVPEEYRKIAFIRGYVPLIIFAGLFVFILLLQAIANGGNQTKVRISDYSSSQKSVSSSRDGKSRVKASESSETVPQISVHVTGYVRSPGVFKVGGGARVVDVVRLADPKEDACLDALNLARKVEDGERIYVPGKEEMKKAGWPGVLVNQIVASGGEDLNSAASGSGSGSGNSPGRKLDLNTCTRDELIGVPGIGEKTAEKIIAYREKKGGFRSVEELIEVSGIGEKKLESLKDYFVVVK